MSKRDYYEVLGLERNCTQDQIKKAFRSRARHLHPDNADSGDEAAFKELAAAYEVLSDENKRALYDRYGHDGLAGGSSGFEGVDLGSFADLGEIFSQFFGGSGRSGFRRSPEERGADLRFDLELDFHEAVFGIERKISIKRQEGCATCDGLGAAAGSSPVKCGTCAGQGQIKQATATFLGHFTQVIVCPNCQGEGTRIEKPCSNCKGRGQVRQGHDIQLKVPAGVDTGSRIRIPGAGDKGRKNGPAGDLYVIIHVRQHPLLAREGVTIHLQQTIGFSLAALGGEISVPTVDGVRVLKIPAGVQSGAVLAMKEMGVPHLNSPGRRGDQLVHLVLATPTRLNAEERKLLERLAQIRGEKLTVADDKQPVEPVKENQSIIDKIADAFKTKDEKSGE